MNNTNRDVRIIVEQRNKSERLVGGEQGCLWHAERDREVYRLRHCWGLDVCHACVPLLESLIMAYQTPPLSESHWHSLFTRTLTNLCVSAHNHTHTLSQVYSTFMCGCGRGIKKNTN